MLIIDDSNAHKFVDDVPVGMGRGRIPRDWSKQPFGAVATAFDRSMIIPRSEWSRMISDRKNAKQTIKDQSDSLGVKVKNQAQTNYCWFNAPTHCVEILRAVNGMGYVPLSAASGAARLTRFQNVGGWGGDALKWIIDHGVNTEAEWPRNAIDKRYDTPATVASARRNRVTEWYELPNRSFDALASCLLLGFPVAIGLNWWGHEVTAIDLEETSPGRFGALIDNSWDDNWGENGRAVLSESKATPDDAVSPRVVTVV